jgi:hypothetical protein
MTSQQNSDVDGRDEPAGAAAAQQQDSDTLAKSYRYLRLAMVGLLLCRYRAAVRACREAGTPLLTEKASTGLDCPTVQALADATKANVDNNLFALLFVGAIALLVSLAVAWRDGTLNLDPPKRTCA